MKITNLPEDTHYHETKHFNAFTIPNDGFEKLVGFSSDNVKWIHKDYRLKTKKNKKKKRK